MKIINCLREKKENLHEMSFRKDNSLSELKLEKEFSLQVLDPGQRERDIFPHIL